MGRMYAEGIRETEASLEQQISWHFKGNCYPPPPQEMIPVAVAAINAIVEDQDWDRMIDLPEGVQYRGEDQVAAHQVVESFRLDAWVDHIEWE